jgi:hypothetical protein
MVVFFQVYGILSQFFMRERKDGGEKINPNEALLRNFNESIKGAQHVLRPFSIDVRF